MAEYKINQDGEVVFKDKKRIAPQYDPLWKEFAQLEYEVLNNHHNPTKDPIKIARYNELKKHFNIKASEDALKQAKEKLKQKIIAANKSNDKSITFAAMTQFKEKDE